MREEAYRIFMTEVVKSIGKVFGVQSNFSYLDFVLDNNNNKKEETAEEIIERMRNKLR